MIFIVRVLKIFDPKPLSDIKLSVNLPYASILTSN